MKATARKLPRQKRSQVTVNCILTAATHILKTTYPDGYNTNDIAALAGVSIGSLYQYFPSKEAISLALIIREKLKVLTEIENADDLAQTIPFADALSHFIRALVLFQIEAGLLHRNLEIEERRLLTNSELVEVNRQIADANRHFFSKNLSLVGHPAKFVDDIANDVRCIVKAILECDLQKEEMKIDYLFMRLSRAVFGYLQAMRQPNVNSLEAPCIK